MSILKFEFRGEPNHDAIESDITLALFASECVFGKDRVHLEASYLVEDDGSACVINTCGEAAEAAARIFAGLTAARVGEAAYSVQRVSENQ